MKWLDEYLDYAVSSSCDEYVVLFRATQRIGTGSTAHVTYVTYVTALRNKACSHAGTLARGKEFSFQETAQSIIANLLRGWKLGGGKVILYVID